MSLESGGIDHDGPRGIRPGRQPRHHAGEHPHRRPSLPAIAHGPWRPIPGGIAPPQAVAVDEDDPARHPPVIDPWSAVALGKEGLTTRHPLDRQPAEIARSQPLRTEASVTRTQAPRRDRWVPSPGPTDGRCGVPPAIASSCGPKATERPSVALARAASSTSRRAMPSAAVTGGGAPCRTASAKAAWWTWQRPCSAGTRTGASAVRRMPRPASGSNPHRSGSSRRRAPPRMAWPWTSVPWDADPPASP